MNRNQSLPAPERQHVKGTHGRCRFSGLLRLAELIQEALADAKALDELLPPLEDAVLLLCEFTLVGRLLQGRDSLADEKPQCGDLGNVSDRRCLTARRVSSCSCATTIPEMTGSARR